MKTYLSTTSLDTVTVDLASAAPEALLDYYQSMLDRSGSGGAFPGSKGWRAAQPFVLALREIEAARPDVTALRAARAAAVRDARIANTYQD